MQLLYIVITNIANFGNIYNFLINIDNNVTINVIKVSNVSKKVSKDNNVTKKVSNVIL